MKRRVKLDHFLVEIVWWKINWIKRSKINWTWFSSYFH